MYSSLEKSIEQQARTYIHLTDCLQLEWQNENVPSCFLWLDSSCHLIAE